MNNSEFIGRRFNRREVKWALRSDSIEVTQYFVGLSTVDALRLTGMMFEELRLSDFLAYMFACREAVNLVEEHEDDKREMFDKISLEIECLGSAEVIANEKKRNLAIATYVSVVRANETSRFMEIVSEFREGEGPIR